jgi:hypothetical protein
LSSDATGVDPPPPGVQNRTYGNTAAGFRELLYDASGGIPGYVFTLPATIAAPGTGVPAPTTCASSATQASCTSGTATITAAAGTYSFNIALDDTGNASTPKGSVSSTAYSFPTPKTIVINSPLAFTVDAASAPVNPAPPGVVGRSYGNTGAGFKDLAFDGAGGLAPYIFGLPAPVASPAANGVPAGMACTPSGATLACTTGAATISASPGTYPFSITLNDAANATTPSASAVGAQPAAIPGSIAVNQEMTFSAQPPTPYPDAVDTRSYGQAVSGCSPVSACTPLTYTITSGSGLGGYSFAPTNFPANFVTCSQTGNTENCSSASVTATASGTPYSGLRMAATDTSNQATPSNTVGSTSTSVTIHPEMTFSAQPPTTFPDAVNPRSYGSASTGCSPGPACTPLTYTVTGGSGLGSYSFTPNNFPAGFVTCSQSTNAETCSSASVTTTASTTPYPGLSMTVRDTGNQMTANNSITSNSGSVTVHQDLGVTVITTNPVAAVTGRHYGSPLDLTCNNGTPNVACAPLDYQLSNGLGNYTLTGSSLTTSADTFTCTLTSPNFLCSVGPNPSGNPTAIQGVSTKSPYTLTFVGAETGNASTPGNTKTDTSQTLPIVPELTVTPPASVAAAVTGRRYGTGAGCSGGSCVALNYKLNNGLGKYTLTGNSLTTPQDTFTCTLTSPNYFCSDASIVGTTSPATLTFVGAETGNISTPGNTKTDTSQSLTINAVLTVNDPTPFPVPAAVTGRLYGSGSGCGTGGTCVPLAYNPTGGITPYAVITGSGFPAPITCTQSSNTLNCSASSTITGTTSTGTISVTDSNNASTPSGTTSRSSDSITVDATLAITNTVLPNGLLGFEYNPSGPGVTLTTTGGLGTALTWVGPGATAGACTTAPTGTLDPDLTLSSAGLLSSDGNALTTASTATTQWTFQVCVSDTGNATTPAGFALPATTGNEFVVNVLNTLAYVAENSANKVAIINTTSNTAGTPLSTNISTPDSVAISPNGRQAYVTMGNNDIAVVDTITQGHFGNSPFALPAGCVAPTGIAITPDGTQFYVACPGGNEVLVFSAITSTTTSPLTALATISTGAGSTPESVAFKPDGTRAYATLSGNNKLAIINTSTQVQITSSPFTLSALNTAPQGIALATNGTEIYAYIAKGAAGSGQPGVEVEDITSDPSASPLTPVANLQTGAGSAPNSVAVLPDSSRVYVTLEGANQFAVIDNTVTPPAQIVNSPYNLPTPGSPATASAPLGVTSPPLSPVPGAGYRVYLCLSNAAQSNVAVMGDLGNTTTTPPTPAEDPASPVTIDASATPTGIANIPVPK